MMEQKKLTKILIVDDDEDILTISRYSLSINPDLEIRCVNSGEEALKTALEMHPDLILLDLMMPSMDGTATMRAIKLIPSIAQIPIAFFTARTGAKEVESFLKLGVVDVITKPFDPMELPNIVQKIWEKHQSTLS
jgi:CheY-like chemotaxis protein